MNKKDLSERDICSKFIGPAVKRAGWDGMMQIREEVAFTKGRIIVRGKLVTRGKAKRADYILYYKPNIPIAIIEAKDNNHSVGDGMQQALDYAVTLNIPFVFSSNGDGFVFHDRTGRVAFSAGEPKWGIWVADSVRNTTTRVGGTADAVAFPQWLDNGKRLAFRCRISTDSKVSFCTGLSDGTGEPQAIVSAARSVGTDTGVTPVILRVSERA